MNPLLDFSGLPRFADFKPEHVAVSYGKATVYFPIVDLLKNYFKIQDRDDHREICQKVIGKLLALDRTLEPTLSAFFALLMYPLRTPNGNLSIHPSVVSGSSTL